MKEADHEALVERLAQVIYDEQSSTSGEIARAVLAGLDLPGMLAKEREAACHRVTMLFREMTNQNAPWVPLLHKVHSDVCRAIREQDYG